MTPPLCDEPAAPADPAEATRVARWLSAELGRLHVELAGAHREAVALAESLDGLARQATPRLSVADGDRLRGIRARADALAARLAPVGRPKLF